MRTLFSGIFRAIFVFVLRTVGVVVLRFVRIVAAQMVMEMSAPVQPAARVGGQMLSEMTGKLVCLMGKASEPSSDGKSFKLKTTDGTVVSVMLSEPLNTYVDGLVEVVGTVRNEGVHCQEYIVFTEEQTKSFDFTQYNSAVELINKHPDYYPLVQEQQEDMQM